MRDVLAGGCLVTTDPVGPLARRAPYARRRRVARVRKPMHETPATLFNQVQPGQLASPVLKFGFPSLALH